MLHSCHVKRMGRTGNPSVTLTGAVTHYSCLLALWSHQISFVVFIVLCICNIGFYSDGAASDGGFAAILSTLSSSSFCQLGDIVDSIVDCRIDISDS